MHGSVCVWNCAYFWLCGLVHSWIGYRLSDNYMYHQLEYSVGGPFLGCCDADLQAKIIKYYQTFKFNRAPTSATCEFFWLKAVDDGTCGNA